jgi:hypothetical protein
MDFGRSWRGVFSSCLDLVMVACETYVFEHGRKLRVAMRCTMDPAGLPNSEQGSHCFAVIGKVRNKETTKLCE